MELSSCKLELKTLTVKLRLNNRNLALNEWQLDNRIALNEQLSKRNISADAYYYYRFALLILMLRLVLRIVAQQ